ncbi:CvpA family protein [Erysipelothrix sp. HDW6B]|uniref:CvpA family protein n=1 Tax=Erysipelothrix TaxID=1647 RepID=UPI00135AB757|nr:MULTISPECIES: CvpA family protein [Erysipelothrix]QIK85819.1 CvpA family protein [Erysipelothrix sp. HDW6B]
MITFPSDWMIYLNGVIIIWFLIDLYRGYKRGMLLQIVDVVGTFVALFAAWLLSPAFSKVITFVKLDGNGLVTINQFVGNQVNRLIWFVVLFVVIRILLLLVTPLASFISKMPLIKQVNSAIGGVFAVVMFGVKLMIAILLLSTPLIINGQDVVNNTWLKQVNEVGQPVLVFVDDFIIRNDAIQSIIMEQKLPDEQEQAMVKWLTDNNFTDQEIKEFLNKYE